MAILSLPGRHQLHPLPSDNPFQIRVSSNSLPPAFTTKPPLVDSSPCRNGLRFCNSSAPRWKPLEYARPGGKQQALSVPGLHFSKSSWYVLCIYMPHMPLQYVCQEGGPRSDDGSFLSESSGGNLVWFTACSCAVLGFVGIFVSVRYVSACPATQKTSRGGKLFGRFRVQTCDVAQTKHGSCRQQLELGPVVFGLQLVPKHVWNLGITCWCCPKSEQVILK